MPEIKKISILKWMLVFLGIALLSYAFFFVRQVLQYRNQILSGNYNFESYAGTVSGAGGANVSNSFYAVETPDDPALGSSNPKVVIVEFADFECPYCQAAFPIIRQLAAKYKDTIRYQYRDFPIDAIHANAYYASLAGSCADEQGKFWVLHDTLYQNQNALSQENITTYAQQLGLNMQEFNACMLSERVKAEVDADIADGVKAGVQGTPTWFINGTRVAGVIPAEVFEKVIEDIINNN